MSHRAREPAVNVNICCSIGELRFAKVFDGRLTRLWRVSDNLLASCCCKIVSETMRVNVAGVVAQKTFGIDAVDPLATFFVGRRDAEHLGKCRPRVGGRA